MEKKKLMEPDLDAEFNSLAYCVRLAIETMHTTEDDLPCS